MSWNAVWPWMVCLLAVVQARGASLEPAEFPSLISSVRAIGPVSFCCEEVPLEKEGIRERLEKELLLYVWNRPQVILWLKRTPRYFPHIERILREADMPEDLKFVTVVESALLPDVRSVKGAVGFWQFVPDTGRKYGLVINGRIDERRNLFASTRAAALYLQELYAIFDSWALALAAYNMGEDGLSAEILEQETTDYYELSLPLETERFVLRMLAVKLILSGPEMFGFHLTEEDYYPPMAFDEVKVDCLEQTPIRIIAQAAQTRFKVIKELNPEIRGHHLAAGQYRLLVPEGSSDGFLARFRDLQKAFLAGKRQRTYVIKKGDNLSAIAEALNIPVSALIICNNLDPRKPIYPGRRLFVCNEGIKPAAKNAERTPTQQEREISGFDVPPY